MHLSDVKEFHELTHQVWLKRLSELNIRHVEQLGSLLAAPDGRYALNQLGVPVDEVQRAIEPVLRDRLGLSLSSPFKRGSGQRVALLTHDRHAMGYSAGDRDPFWEAAFDTALPDPPKAASAPELPDEEIPTPQPSRILLERYEDFSVRDQGRRGTCVAFTAVGMYYQMGIRAATTPAALSPQYLYYRAKCDDSVADIDEDGTSIEVALHVLQKHGCCLDRSLEYVPRHDIPQNYRVKGHKTRCPEADLRDLARQHRISGHRAVAAGVEALKAELCLGRPVGVGLAVYQLAWYNSLGRMWGEIALPLMDTTGPHAKILDNYIGGHAVTLIGYRDNTEEEEDSHRPGGGYFIFRNSWGEDWAPRNDFGRGYGCLPYDYLRRFCLEAQVIDDLARPRPKAASTGKSAATGKDLTTGKKRVISPQPRGEMKPVKLKKRRK
jgi:hypothetical protein